MGLADGRRYKSDGRAQWKYIYIVPSFMGVSISHYKDPYKPISITECHKGFEFYSHV